MLDIADIYSSVTKFSDVCDVKQSPTPMRNRGAPHFNKCAFSGHDGDWQSFDSSVPAVGI